MTTSLEARCRQWLETGNAAERRLAELRLAHPIGTPIPDPSPPPPAPVGLRPVPGAMPADGRELVVAAYDEDLAWLSGVPCRVTVYHKGGRCPDGVPCVPLPNGKREAGSYLHHVVARYDSLAPLTVFTQGHPFDHAPDFLARLSLPYDRPTTLSTRYLEHLPPAAVKATDRVESYHGFELRYGDARAGHGEHAYLDWFNPGAWDYLFDCPMPARVWFSYGACWAVPRENILARPRAFYAHLLEVCDGGDGGSRAGPVNPWSLEALWHYVWSDPAEYPHRVRWSHGEPPLPPLWRQAANLAAAGAAHLADGMRGASPAEQERRWKTCRNCVEHFRPSDLRCGRVDGCGCWLARKIPMASAGCPVGKWGPET